MSNPVDQVMWVMLAAFDPEFGEAWNRRQVAEALSMPNTYLLLAGASGGPLPAGEDATGFALSRGAADEEELLLLAVRPEDRGRSIGATLMTRFIDTARVRGAERLFLEMREGNSAERLYLRHGFREVGRRRNYYNAGGNRRYDALTFLLEYPAK